MGLDKASPTPAQSPAPKADAKNPAVGAENSVAMGAAKIDAGASAAAISAVDSGGMAVSAAAPANMLALFDGTVKQLQDNFVKAKAAHPELDVTWDQVLPAVTAYVNACGKAGTDDKARKAADEEIARFFASIPKVKDAPKAGADAKPNATPAPTTSNGKLPTGGGLATDTDQGQLWSGGDPMKKAAIKEGDALESSFAGALFDGVELRLADGTKPNTWGVWDEMSRILAAGMTGRVTISMMFGLRPGSVFERVESKELEHLMKGPAPIVTGITVKRYLRAAKGVDKKTGRPYTTAESGTVLDKDVDCPTVAAALNVEPYRWDRDKDLPNPFFAVAGGHTTGAPPVFDATSGLAPSKDWGYEKGLKGAGKTPEW